MRKERAFTPKTDNEDEIPRMQLIRDSGCPHPYYLEKAIEKGILNVEKVETSKGVFKPVYLKSHIKPLRDFCFDDIQDGETVIFRYAGSHF